MADQYTATDERNDNSGRTWETPSGEPWPVGSWLSAALDDPNVCDAMKADIRHWFEAGGSVMPGPPVAWSIEAGAHGLPAVTLSPAVRDDWIRYGRPVTGLYER